MPDMTMNDRRRLPEITRAFLGLGLTSFGGPVAHLGYFHEELVRRRGWVTDATYAEIVALAQLLPGPASSQVAFAMGWQRGGAIGALLASLAFTLPSAVAMLFLALVIGGSADPGGVLAGVIGGLKITAVAIVAHAVLGMARSLTPDLPRAAIAIATFALMAVALAPALAQPAAILTGGLAGLLFLRSDQGAIGHATPRGPSRRIAGLCLAIFAILLIGLPIVALHGSLPAIADVFYRAGALVFGGGHVVLPLLQAGTVGTGMVPQDSFIAAYGAAQAMPGPLFTLAAWLGQVAGGFSGAIVALVAIFLPGLLLMAGALPFAARLSASRPTRRAIAGANAAVVGILGHALYDPVMTEAIGAAGDLLLALGLFVVLQLSLRPAWQVVAIGAMGGVVLGL